MRRSIEQGINLEQEPKPKVLVTFHGWQHHPLNLQGIGGFNSSLEAHLKKSDGRKVVFVESATVSRIAADRANTGVRRAGAVRFYIRKLLDDELRRDPLDSEIDIRRAKIDSTSLDEIVEQNLLPFEEIQEYFMFSKMDELSSQHNTEVGFESHSKTILERQEVLRGKVREIADQSFEYWENGDFTLGLDSFKKTHQLMAQAGFSRENELVDDLKSRIKKLAKNNRGSLFMAVGYSHLPLIEILQRKLGNDPGIEFQTNIADISTQPKFIISLSLRNGEMPQDEIFAQEFLLSQITREIQKELQSKKCLELFANFFEDLNVIKIRVVTALSLPEIRRICEEKQDVLDLLRNHPLANLLKSI